jgi:hypothetical protein
LLALYAAVEDVPEHPATWAWGWSVVSPFPSLRNAPLDPEPLAEHALAGGDPQTMACVAVAIELCAGLRHQAASAVVALWNALDPPGLSGAMLQCFDAEHRLAVRAALALRAGLAEWTVGQGRAVEPVALAPPHVEPKRLAIALPSRDGWRRPLPRRASPPTAAVAA